MIIRMITAILLFFSSIQPLMADYIENESGRIRLFKKDSINTREIQFRDDKGKEIKKLKLKYKYKDKPKKYIEKYETKLSKDKGCVVVNYFSFDRNKDPLQIRQGKNGKVTWYDKNGNTIGTWEHTGGPSIQAISNNGSVVAFSDIGFDTAYYEGTDLTDCNFYVVNSKKNILFKNSFSGCPDDVDLSPDGKWLTYTTDLIKIHVINLINGKSQSFNEDITTVIEVGDEGTLTTWKIIDDKSYYRKENNQPRYVPGDLKLQKFIRNWNAPKFKPTSEFKNVKQR